MLKAEGLQIEREPFVSDGPLLGQIEKLPLAAALAAAVVVSVHPLPALVGPGRVPDHLGVRPDQQIIPPALQFFTI